MTFTGFDPEALALLAELPSWDGDRYDRDRDRLASGLTGPGRALIEDLAQSLDADLTTSPRSSVSPLHRDLRFAPPDAPRYKDHLLLTTWEGPDKKTSPVLWVRIDATRAGFATGIGFTPAIRQRWRDAVAGPTGAELAHHLDRLVADRRADLAGDRLKRVPAPHPADHPRADLLRATGFQVRLAEPLPDRVDDPALLAWCRDRLEVLLPVHRWLVAHLVPAGPSSRSRATSATSAAGAARGAS